MSDRDPWTDLVHRLDTVPDPAPGLPPAADLRRRGERRHRTRVAVAAAVGGAGVAGALALTGVLGGGGLRTTPVPPATSSSSPTVVPSLVPTPSGPSGRSSPAASPGAASDLSGLLLRPRDLAGVGAAGRAWRQERTARLSVGCDPAAPVAGDSPAVTLAELAADGRPAEAEGPVVQQVVAADPDQGSLAPCAGSTWTTLRDDGGLLVQRHNGDPTKSESPWASYRFVIRPETGALVGIAFLGEAIEKDAVALRIGERMLQRATGRSISADTVPVALRSTDLLPASALGPAWSLDLSAERPADGLLAYLPCVAPSARPKPEQTLAGALSETVDTMPSLARQQLTRFRSADVAAAWVADVRRATGCGSTAERSDVTVRGGVALHEPTPGALAVRTVLVQRVGPIVSVTRIVVGDGEVPAGLAKQAADGASTALCRWSPGRTCR